MSIASPVRISPEEYLASERLAEVRHEYRDGEVVEMVGTSRAHNRIALNINMYLGPKLLEIGSEMLGLDMRTKVSASGLYTYPDLVIVIGEPELEDDHLDTLLNPTVIIEVLSPSTEKYDRTEKFEHYKKIGTFREYVLISQDRPQVEQVFLSATQSWLKETYVGLSATLELKSQPFSIPLAEIYRRIDFARNRKGN